MRYRLVETDNRIGVLGGRLTLRGAQKLKRQHSPLAMFGVYPMWHTEIEWNGEGWERWQVVCYQNLLVQRVERGQE
jgi:hypothetical protein